MRARAPGQRKNDVAEDVGGGEWPDLVIVWESKGEREQGRCRVVSCRLVSGRIAISSVSRPFGSLGCWE